MVRKILFKALNYALLTSLVLSKSSNDCEEIKKLCKSKYENAIRNCKTNSNGNVVELALQADDIDKQEDLEKILSYDTITNLKYYYDMKPITKKAFAISKLTNLKELFIGNFNTGHSAEEVYTQGRGYRTFGVDENVIKSIPKSVKKLEVLISYSQKNIDEICSLSQLEELELRELSMDLKFDKLKNLNISKLTIGNPIIEKNLTKEIANLSKLKELVLNGNAIDEISFESGAFRALNQSKKLKKLTITNTDMRQDEFDEMCTLTKIEELKIYNSYLDQMNKFSSLKNLSSNLKRLEIDNCRLDNCPTEISNLKNLKYLNLKNNYLKKFPKEIANLKNLEYLDLSSNRIEDEIPETYNQLSNLKTINVSKNEAVSGKTLTNDNLEVCKYNEGNYTRNFTVCKAKDMKCLKEDIKSCSTSTTTTPTSTIATNLPISTNGQCGGKYGHCPSGQCCSKYGWCGTSDSHCGNGCQSYFGQCNPASSNISTDGRCGEKFGICPEGSCCSKYGWCGTGSTYCDSGCQKSFGKCN